MLACVECKFSANAIGYQDKKVAPFLTVSCFYMKHKICKYKQIALCYFEFSFVIFLEICPKFGGKLFVEQRPAQERHLKKHLSTLL